MSSYSQDLKRYFECNRLPRSFLLKLVAPLLFPGVQFVFSYRIRAWFARHHLGVLEILMLRMEEMIFSTSVLRYYGVQIGPGLYMPHPFGIVIGGATIGKNFTIAQNCTVGGQKPVGALGVEPPGWESRDRIVIGDWVFMGAGSCVLGPVTIGDNVIIGANSVVTRDLPANVMVAGAPAKIIKQL